MAKARTEMGDAARQAYDANERKRVHKARYRWRKVTAERSAIVPVANVKGAESQ